ncbi:MAG TPA: EAL domain-containing protein [Gammaproteobacteria bacterium]|nr:EAL domain-containing protein [Gammaproteobacteria bacterium]
MRQFSFRHKVLLLAVALVTVIQFVALVPVLNAVKLDVDQRARKNVELAGVLFDETVSNRAVQLSSTVKVLVADYGFKQAFASGDRETIRSALANQAGRASAPVALLLDLDGNVVASSAGDEDTAYGAGFTPLPQGASLESVSNRVVPLGGVPYWTVTVPLRVPDTRAEVMLGFPIDEELAARLQSLTGLSVSFVRFAGASPPQVIVSTLPRESRTAALAGVEPGLFGAQKTAGPHGGYISLLRPFLSGSDVHVALQLSLDEANASYRRIRNILLTITSLSLLLAIVGSFWLAQTVTRPVRNLVAAARRMREGVYTEEIPVRSSDELGELAGSFNAMQQAIADRERHIFHTAHHDSLSGLPNRELFISQLRTAIEAGGPIGVVVIGLDRFAGIVSSLGHRAGDEVVKLAAGLLRGRVGEGQLIGHVSAHEFLFALPGFDAQQTLQWVEYQVDLLRGGVRIGGANVSLQATAGIACFPEHSRDAAELCRRASSARSEALARHETACVYRLGQDDRSLRQIRIVGDFPQALEKGELRLNFQPKVDCRTREVYGAEALVRWQHPDLGLLTPDAFVGAIEQAGGIAHLTRWVLREAVVRVAGWRDQGLKLSVAVNISVDDLVDEYLPYYLLDLVKQHRLEPKQITLEVTESAIMHNVHKSLAVVSCIHELGFRIAVDDFGTGQSALAQLKRLPVDELKIDKSFVMSMQEPKDEAIVRTTIELAHKLGLSVVAEGVETAEVLDRLTSFGCEYAQGYQIGKPLPPADFLTFLARWQAGNTQGVVPFAARGK